MSSNIRNLAKIVASKLSLEECRQEYRAIRARSHAKRADFEVAVAKLVPEGLEGLDKARAYVRAARKARFTCRRCAGTGRFITMVVNGKPTGPGGKCFRCNGHGTRNDADQRRNYGADLHRRVW
jgi:hypothetical protein